MARTIRVLSIDGGGIRGIIPALVLGEIERRTERPVAELFDLIAGTSTGGILALGLTVPGPDGKPKYCADELVQLYKEEGPRIFHRPTWHRIRSVGGVAEEKYPSKGIEEVLQKYFDKARLKEALTDVLVTSYEIERRTPFFFRSRRARENRDYDFPMWQVARATSAAPTYFEPCRIPVNGKKDDFWTLIDGGVFANNPTMCALADVLAEAGPDDRILVLSLGTGELTRPLWYDDAKDWGLAGWAQPILSVVFHGVAETVRYQAAKLLERGNGHEYYRFQVRLDEGSDDMDDAGKTNLRVLQLLAEALIRDEERELDKICTALTALAEPRRRPKVPSGQ